LEEGRQEEGCQAAGVRHATNRAGRHRGEVAGAELAVSFEPTAGRVSVQVLIGRGMAMSGRPPQVNWGWGHAGVGEGWEGHPMAGGNVVVTNQGNKGTRGQNCRHTMAGGMGMNQGRRGGCTGGGVCGGVGWGG